MDERLAKALEFSNLRHTLHLEKRRLQEKLKADLTLSYNGGVFQIDRNFIVFLNLLTPDEDTTSTVVLDDRQDPIYIENLQEFKRKALNVYHRCINQYYVDFEALKKKRSVKAVVDL
jgi:hypothetical protein